MEATKGKTISKLAKDRNVVFFVLSIAKLQSRGIFGHLGMFDGGREILLRGCSSIDVYSSLSFLDFLSRSSLRSWMLGFSFVLVMGFEVFDHEYWGTSLHDFMF